jgi:hypothetical protein
LLDRPHRTTCYNRFKSHLLLLTNFGLPTRDEASAY